MLERGADGQRVGRRSVLDLSVMVSEQQFVAEREGESARGGGRKRCRAKPHILNPKRQTLNVQDKWEQVSIPTASISVFHFHYRGREGGR
jgi:hypothetical protein